MTCGKCGHQRSVHGWRGNKADAEKRYQGACLAERCGCWQYLPRCASVHTETKGRARSWRCDLPTDGHTRHRSISGKRTWNTKETT